ncbi:winged helix-turn-helix transcriptional regulator [Nocardioides mangrovi]|uniref:Helix-turn-helix transcriptional regulator n=1 Tax=Nocardioides mangrovi TaxID=2874580 RepID=A0ABS7UBB6_9ACTN|nr:helix-turn-helix domain-containing protein [Nocardioides mangrovi]MBZ5738140.1 helix-turn-helix transcriptional regulator [Nocardioides mangrovi]
MSQYGQFCPVAKAMEVLDERWTLLVIRELLAGSTHFNELRRGNPKMSPALLSRRLRSLERAGVVRRDLEDGRTSYHLTAAGEELRPVVEGLGAWGIRWIGDLGEDDLDPHLLLWDMRRTVPVEEWPAQRTVVHFHFADQPSATARWWLCVADQQADVCDYDPGYEVTATVETTLSTMVRLWRVDRTWSDALRAGDLRVDAPTDVRRAMPTWLGQMSLGAVPHDLREPAAVR